MPSDPTPAERVEEIWRPVVGFENHYMVSNFGRVCSITRMTLGRWGNKKTSPGGLINGEICKTGYRRYQLSKDGKINRLLGHRLVATAFIPNPMGKPCVNHIDSNRDNNMASNLEWCTYRENTVHAMLTGYMTKEAVLLRQKLKGTGNNE